MTTDELRNIVAHIVIGFARKDEAESGINSAKPYVLKATWDSSSGEYSIADYDRTALHTAVNGGRVALLKFDNGNMADYTLVYVTSNSASDTFGGVSDGTLFSANLSSLNGAVAIATYDVSDIVVIRSGASKGATAYQKPSGGIPKSDLASAVQTSLGKADTALQSFTESDPTVPAWAKASSKPTYTAAEVGALPSTTSIPTKTSDLTNDSNFVVDADYVHTDSNYTAAEKSKLSGISAGAEANVQSDWSVTETTSDAFIKNKPTIPTESTVSGWGFTKSTGTITGIKMNGASKGTSGVVDLGTVLTSESDPTVPSWAKQRTKPTYNGGEVKYTGTTGNVVTNNTTLNVAIKAIDDAIGNVETLLASI